MPQIRTLVAVFFAATALTGCAAIAIVDTAVGVTATVVGAAVDVGGAVVSTAADAVKPSGDSKPDCSKESNKDKDACKNLDSPED